jgi:hypothetical protein
MNASTKKQHFSLLVCYGAGTKHRTYMKQIFSDTGTCTVPVGIKHPCRIGSQELDPTKAESLTLNFKNPKILKQ